MSLVLMESCDLPSVVGSKWTTYNPTSTGVTTDGRTAWRLNDGNTTGIRKAFPSQEHATVVVGWRMYVTAFGSGGTTVQFVGDDSTVIHVELDQVNADGSLQVRRGAGGTVLATSASGALSVNQWQYVEFKATINDTTGSIEVRVDNQTVISETGIDTRNGGTDALVDEVRIFRTTFSSSVMDFRDVYLLTGAGSALNDFQGPVIIQARLPDGAGDLAEWTPNTAANWQEVDDPGANDGDTTIVESTAAGNRDTYAVTDVTAYTTDPLAVQAHVVARYGASPLNIATCLRRSATNDDGAADAPSGSYGTRAVTIWETDPVAAGAWTLANLNSTQFGVLSSAP